MYRSKKQLIQRKEKIFFFLISVWNLNEVREFYFLFGEPFVCMCNLIESEDLKKEERERMGLDSFSKSRAHNYGLTYVPIHRFAVLLFGFFRRWTLWGYIMQPTRIRNFQAWIRISISRMREKICRMFAQISRLGPIDKASNFCTYIFAFPLYDVKI